jgi:hypothetical protein
VCVSPVNPSLVCSASMCPTMHVVVHCENYQLVDVPRQPRQASGRFIVTSLGTCTNKAYRYVSANLLIPLCVSFLLIPLCVLEQWSSSCFPTNWVIIPLFLIPIVRNRFHQPAHSTLADTHLTKLPVACTSTHGCFIINLTFCDYSL